eukprot:1427925-Rhodomonas_salina.5
MPVFHAVVAYIKWSRRSVSLTINCRAFQFERSIKEDNPIFGSGKGMMTMVSVGAAAGIAAGEPPVSCAP